MFHALLDDVRREVSGERALDSVRALTRFHRVQASPGFDGAAEWLAEQLSARGLEVEIERVPGDGRTRFLGTLMPEGWTCTRATATLVSGGGCERLCDYGAEKLSLILRSAPARGRFPLRVLEDGTEDAHYEGLDVRGHVVLTRGAVRRVHELAVVERGAAGILYDGRRLLPPVRDASHDPDSLAYTSFWWQGEEPRGWGFVLSPLRGERLRAALRRGEGLELEVEIESRAFSTSMPLVSARLQAGVEDEVLVVSHLCHPQPSANDNASGVAANLEAARALATLRSCGKLGPQRLGLRFLWVPELTGTYAWLREPHRVRGTVAALNLDMVGEDQERCGSTFLLEHPPCFAASFAEDLLGRIRERAVDWVESYSGPGHYSMTRMAEVPYSGGSDHAVFVDPAIGVPCPMLIQWPDRYYHSSLDTPDKCDPRSLGLAARCAATYAGFLATAGEVERSWLLGAVARGARARLLGAMEGEDPPRLVARERLRGRSALASLGRLGVAAADIEREWQALEVFADREAPVTPAKLPGASGAGGRPRRHIGAPLDYQPHLLRGYERLPREARERWHRAISAAGAGTLAELAWYACDGSRTIEEIAGLVWLETGQFAPDLVGHLFTFTAALGLCALEGEETTAWSSRRPSTASR